MREARGTGATGGAGGAPGSTVNSTAIDRGPTLFQDDVTGIVTLYFSSFRSGGAGYEDIYASTLEADGTFAPPVLVPELSTTSNDSVPAIRRDGLEIFLSSGRPGPGQVGLTDLWVSTRASASDPWSNPVNLGATVNSTVLDFRPGISFDGKALYFHSERPGGYGGYDLYVTTRTKVKTN